MYIEDFDSETLWRYYQRGYYCLIRSGRYFRQVLRPALSHVYFQRAVPLLVEYSRANHGAGELPPGFGDQLEACPLTARDLLHLDYAICLGFAEAQGSDPAALAASPVLEWPGPGGFSGVFIAADALISRQVEAFAEELEEEGDEFEDTEDDSNPPFDL